MEDGLTLVLVIVLCLVLRPLISAIPFFAFKNGHNFAKSILGQMFACRKDMFYRFLANADINWRQIVYSFNRRLLRRIAMRSDSVKSKGPAA